MSKRTLLISLQKTPKCWGIVLEAGMYSKLLLEQALKHDGQVLVAKHLNYCGI